MVFQRRTLTVFAAAASVNVLYQATLALAQVKAKAFCTEGFTLDSSGTLCVKNLRQPFTVSCPSNCEFDSNGTCSCVEETRTELSCPPGFSLEASQKACSTTVETPPVQACPADRRLINNKCTGVAVTPPESVCPPPSSLKGDLCSQEDTTAPKQHCPPGFELSAPKTGPVSETATADLRSLGIFGRTRKTDDDEEVSGSIFEKPENERKKPFGSGLRAAQLHSGGSVSNTGSVAYEVSPPSASSFAPVLTANPSAATIPAFCLSNEMTPARPSCPPSHRFESGVCVSEILDAVEMRCDGGYHYDEATRSCVQESLIPSNSDCPAGYYLEGNLCVASEVEEAQRSCRDGFTYHADENMCVKVLKEPPRLKCPGADYYFDGRSCERRRTVAPTHNCASGRLMNDACLVVEAKPATPSCPPNASLDSKLMKCLSSSVAPVKYSCSQGELTEENMCLSRKTRAVEAICPDGFDQQGNTCVKEKVFQPVASCPPGATLVGADCLLQKESTPTLTCGPGFQLEGDKCVMAKKVAPLQACAAGYTPYKEKCIKQTRRSGQITCPDGFTYDGTQCVVNDQQKPIFMCPEGYTPQGDLGDCVFQVDDIGSIEHEFPRDVELKAAGLAVPEEKKKTGLQIMSFGRRKPQFMMS
ncbi:oocyst wall protein [Cystoisospora suis]|uniref:Oocyst wall protein n=1 Tax=Cystoisospora suis TaxID=483139 RepID=A0A2C6KUI0_9APIC|nr:oocyst wall protein [Cystoisospora suis]